jgi:eukaryotic-like serine/threonine-protein kinase
MRQARSWGLAAFRAKPCERTGQLVAGRYRLLGLLGHGLTAGVYLALDTQLGTHVVVKQLAPQNEANEALRERFLAEANALAALQHPGVVRVLDYAAPSDERPYLVMEALVGETLAALLQRRPRLPTELALRIARYTAQGLAAAHAAGIVHRDIKPDNLFLLGPLGDPFGVKIIDLGMPKLPNDGSSSGVHTVLGTIEYMAPEQVTADGVDCRTDIYAFGIVLFRLFTGHLPFETPKGYDLLCHQLLTAVPPPSWVDGDIEPFLDALIVRATRKHPDNRFPDMQALSFALECQSIDSAPLVVDPDVYVPRNEKGREVAQLLAERQAAQLPADCEGTERELALRWLRWRSIAPPPPVEDEADFDDLPEDALELCEA